MNSEIMQAWAAILAALSWPLVALIVVAIFYRALITGVKEGRFSFRLGLKDIAELSVEPTKGIRPPSTTTEASSQQLTEDVDLQTNVRQDILPLDYYFLNHTSFLRRKMQAEFRQLTGVPLDHYDIRVIVDSYYHGALERIDRVEYILHQAYPQSIQYRHNPEDKFLLKELANGEYVLMAKVFLKDRKEPVLLQRYITLWESGPRL